MKKITLFFLSISLMGLAGCAGLSILNPAGNHYNGSYNFMVDVSSTPSGAEIYLNNTLVGRTPCRVHIMLKWEMNTWGADFTQRVTEQYALKVSKKGYKDAIEIIPVRSPVTGVLWGEPPKVGLAKTDFHFDLEKEQNE